MFAEKKSVEELDLQFKNNLKNIVPYLNNLKTISDVHLCRSWINRLRQSGDHEKTLRNFYLTELIKQLKYGVLYGPFNKSPSKIGSLPPLSLNKYSQENKYIFDQLLDGEKNDTSYESSNILLDESLVDIMTSPFITRTDSDTSSTKVSNKSFSNVSEPSLTIYNQEVNINSSNLVKDIQHLEQHSMFTMPLVMNDTMEIENHVVAPRVTENSQGGDGFVLTADTNYKLNCVEKDVEELKDQLKFVVDSCYNKNEEMTAMAIEFDKVKNELSKVSNQSTPRDNDVISDMSILKKMSTDMTNKVNQIILEGKGLKKMVLESRENKKQLKLMTALANSLEKRHSEQLEEKQKFFNDQLKERDAKINQLTSYLNVKNKEIKELKQYNADLKRDYDESVIKFEEFIKNKLMKLKNSNQKLVTLAKNMRKYLQTAVKTYEDCKGSNPKQVKEMKEKLSAVDKELQNNLKTTINK